MVKQRNHNLWHRYGDSMLVSDDINRNLKWLRRFKPTGDKTEDIVRFLQASGAEKILVKTKSLDGSLVQLARDMLANHEEELRRVAQGQSPYWLRPADPDRIPLYVDFLRLESAVLRRILGG
jgi:hypothetical protein